MGRNVVSVNKYQQIKKWDNNRYPPLCTGESYYEPRMHKYINIVHDIIGRGEAPAPHQEGCWQQSTPYGAGYSLSTVMCISK